MREWAGGEHAINLRTLRRLWFCGVGYRMLRWRSKRRLSGFVSVGHGECSLSAVCGYASRVVWEGNLGEGTAGYARYSRDYRVVIDGKADLLGTADPAYRGARDRHNPEELFVTAVAACHMLFYLSLCARAGVEVVAYEDDASGTMSGDGRGRGGGRGRFVEITLRPKVTIARAEDAEAAGGMHERAHELCFIANSCAMPIRHVASVRVRAAAEEK